MQNWVQVHETPQGQILVQKDYDYAEADFKVRITFLIEDGALQISPAMGFKGYEAADKCFETFKDKAAVIDFANSQLTALDIAVSESGESILFT